MAEIEVLGLHKRYPAMPSEAVAGIDLEVQAGEVFGLLGPNGAGKTTTVRIGATLLRPSSGTVRVAGHDVVSRPDLARARIGVVSQQNSLDNQLTVGRGVYCHCRYFGFSRRDARRRADELLDRLGVAAHKGHLPMQLSGGLAQRAMIARALSHDPQVLFVDEPTTGLDPQSRLEVWDILRGLRGEGRTVLLTTHNLDEADALCDRVAIMRSGSVVASERPLELKSLAAVETVLEVVVARDHPSLVDVAESVAGVHQVAPAAGGRYRVRGDKRPELLREVFHVLEPYEVTEINVVHPSLETVFLQLLEETPAPVAS